MNYTPLRVKTSYSILSSLNNIKKLVSLTKEYGYKSMYKNDFYEIDGKNWNGINIILEKIDVHKKVLRNEWKKWK